jgi:hypothetical protein
VRSRLNHLDIHLDAVNPKLLELQAAKEILAEIFDIRASEVDDLIQQHIMDFRLKGMEFDLYTMERDRIFR